MRKCKYKFQKCRNSNNSKPDNNMIITIPQPKLQKAQVKLDVKGNKTKQLSVTRLCNPQKPIGYLPLPRDPEAPEHPPHFFPAPQAKIPYDFHLNALSPNDFHSPLPNTKPHTQLSCPPQLPAEAQLIPSPSRRNTHVREEPANGRHNASPIRCAPGDRTTRGCREGNGIGTEESRARNQQPDAGEYREEMGGPAAAGAG